MGHSKEQIWGSCGAAAELGISTLPLLGAEVEVAFLILNKITYIFQRLEM